MTTAFDSIVVEVQLRQSPPSSLLQQITIEQQTSTGTFLVISSPAAVSRNPTSNRSTHTPQSPPHSTDINQNANFTLPTETNHKRNTTRSTDLNSNPTKSSTTKHETSPQHSLSNSLASSPPPHSSQEKPSSTPANQARKTRSSCAGPSTPRPPLRTPLPQPSRIPVQSSGAQTSVHSETDDTQTILAVEIREGEPERMWHKERHRGSHARKFEKPRVEKRKQSM